MHRSAPILVLALLALGSVSAAADGRKPGLGFVCRTGMLTGDGSETPGMLCSALYEKSPVRASWATYRLDGELTLRTAVSDAVIVAPMGDPFVIEIEAVVRSGETLRRRYFCRKDPVAVLEFLPYEEETLRMLGAWTPANVAAVQRFLAVNEPEPVGQET